MTNRKIISCLCLLIMSQVTAAQKNDSLVTKLLRDVAAMQVEKDGEFFAGTFPSFRECGGAPHNLQPDNNIYYSAVIALTLQKMLPQLSNENKAIAHNILNKIRSAYRHYQSNSGLPYYNFWPRGAPILPHTYLLKYLSGVFAMGDDADDTVIISMTDNSSDSTATVLKHGLIATSNLATPQRKIKATYKRYRKAKAYCTYLGNKMTIDFDFAVQCNIMYFMFEKKMPFTEQDTATLQVIADMVKERKYMNSPVYISPYYAQAPILLYHLTRLMSAYKIPELQIYKPQLIKDIQHLLAGKNNNTMDEIILRTCLLRLSQTAPALQLSYADFEKSDQSGYIFFQARAAILFPNILKKTLLHWSYLNYFFYCPAYNKVLWLEYLMEKNKI